MIENHYGTTNTQTQDIKEKLVCLHSPGRELNRELRDGDPVKTDVEATRSRSVLTKCWNICKTFLALKTLWQEPNLVIISLAPWAPLTYFKGEKLLQITNEVQSRGILAKISTITTEHDLFLLKKFTQNFKHAVFLGIQRF